MTVRPFRSIFCVFGPASFSTSASVPTPVILVPLTAIACAVVFFPNGLLLWGTFTVWGFAMLDMVDGAMARASGRSTPFGAVLDATCDRLADGAVFGALVLHLARDEPWLALVALVCLVLGVVVSYVKARAEGLGFDCNTGIMERAERLILVIVGLVFNDFLPLILGILAVLSLVTVVQRLVYVRAQARSGHA